MYHHSTVFGVCFRLLLYSYFIGDGARAKVCDAVRLPIAGKGRQLQQTGQGGRSLNKENDGWSAGANQARKRTILEQ